MRAKTPILLTYVTVTAAMIALGGAHAAVANDRVLWRFEMPSNVAGAFVGVGADGTVYATDNLHLYALTPHGELLWSLSGAGGGRPITFADDGTIYTSRSGTGIRAINPDGTLQWEFMPPANLPLLAGPSVGPDGNIYAVQDTASSGGGLGAFSVDSNGRFRWSDPGDPQIFNTAGGSNSEIVFGPDRFFAGVIGANGPPATYAFDFDGDQIWYSGGSGLSIPATSFPRMLPDGRIVFRLAQTGLMAVQQNGSVDWQVRHPGGASALVAPAVGPNGVIYSGNWSGVRLWAVDPNGTTRWTREHESNHWLSALGVSPDNATIVATGTPGWVRGYDPQNGDLLWQVDLLPEQGLPQIPEVIRPAFSPDARTAYVTTRFVGNGVGHSYLYAIRTGPVPGDMNCDGVLNGADIDPFFLALGDPGAYAARFPNCDPQNGDINGDGRLDGGDIDPFFQCLGGNCP